MKNLNSKFNYISCYLISFFPISLILGNAIVNINIILIISLFFFYLFFLKKINFQILSSDYFKILYSFLFILFISTISSSEKIISLIGSLKLVKSLLFGVSIFFLFLFLENKKKKIVFRFLVLTNFFVILDTLFQYFNSKDIFGFPIDTASGVNRLTGPFGDEQVPGAYIVSFMSIVYFTIFYIFNVNKFFVFKLLYITFCGIVIILTLEKMASLKFLLFFGFILILEIKNNKKNITYYLTAILLIFGSLFFFNSSIKERIDQTIHYTYNKQQGFLVMESPWFLVFRSGINIGKEYYIFGSGPDTFPTLSQKKEFLIKSKNKRTRGQSSGTHPHQIYIELFQSLGIFSILIVSIFFYKIIKNFNLNFSKINPKCYLSFLSIVIISFPLSTTGSLYATWYGGLFFYIFGLTMSIQMSKIRLSLTNNIK